MKDLFYFPSENTLCWVAGYSVDLNTSLVVDILKSIKENAQKFAEAAKLGLPDVHTTEIQKSRRYKYMRVFWAKVPLQNVPKNAHTFENWKMFDWLQD